MSAGDAVRAKINTVEVALRETDAANAANAIVDVLKEIARALDALEDPVKESQSAESKKSWDYSDGIKFL